jgi:hypothetical protein
VFVYVGRIQNLKDLLKGSYHVIQKAAGLFFRKSSGVCLWWELKEPKGPEGPTEQFSGTKAPVSTYGR